MMLESLFISKSRIRRELLALFFTNPSRRYYLRELERLLGHSAGSIRRELLRFSEDGLFNTERVGNLLYYSLNKKHPLYKELRGIVSKTVGVEGALRKALSSTEGIEMAFIYGSFARGKEGAASDVDLMIIGNPDSSLINNKISDIERRLKREINVTLYSLAEYKKRRRGKAGFITELLKRPKIMLVGKEDEEEKPLHL